MKFSIYLNRRVLVMIHFIVSIITGLVKFDNGSLDKMYPKELQGPVVQSIVTLTSSLVVKMLTVLVICVEVLRPSQPSGSCRGRSVYLTTRLLGRLSPLSG